MDRCVLAGAGTGKWRRRGVEGAPRSAGGGARGPLGSSARGGSEAGRRSRGVLPSSHPRRARVRERMAGAGRGRGVSGGAARGGGCGSGGARIPTPRMAQRDEWRAPVSERPTALGIVRCTRRRARRDGRCDARAEKGGRLRAGLARHRWAGRLAVVAAPATQRQVDPRLTNSPRSRGSSRRPRRGATHLRLTLSLLRRNYCCATRPRGHCRRCRSSTASSGAGSRAGAELSQRRTEPSGSFHQRARTSAAEQVRVDGHEHCPAPAMEPRA